MKVRLTMLLAAAASTLAAASANAHVTVASGPAVANKSQEVHFGVGHGCDGDDTFAVRIEIPAGVVSVRPMRSDFGEVAVEKDANDVVTAVTWQKAAEDALDSDIAYYKLTIRLKAPDKPFTQHYFKTQQTCRAADGTLTVVDWAALPGEMGEAAPALTVVPARLPGWNKYTINEHIGDPSIFFQDALIVWRGTAAYSFNPATVELIKGTDGVTELTGGLHPDDEIWVRY